MNKSKRYALEQARNRGIQKSICVAELVQVMEFYPDDMTVDVKPMVKVEQEDSFVEKPPVLKIPVIMLGSIEIPVRPWYKAGDVGLIVYLDQDSDNVLLTGVDSEPQTTGYHTGEHAVFVGTVLCGEMMLEMPENQTEKAISAGMPEQYIAISEEEIKVKAAKKISIESSDEIGIKGAAGIKVEGEVRITGALYVNGVQLPQ